MSLEKYIRSIPYLKEIALYAHRHSADVYLVGGALRDYFLERKGAFKDFDFAVQSGARKLAEHIARLSQGTLVVLDEDTKSYRVVVKTADTNLNFDFTGFRAQTIEEDVRKRDFTINALVVHLNPYPSVQLKDPLGAAADFQKKLLRAPSVQTFRDDPLRILRAFSLRALCDFRFDPATRASMAKARHLLSKVSAERISEELFKILKADSAHSLIKDMADSGILEVILPQIKKMQGCRQGEYHHLDVWDHTMLVLYKFEELISRKKLSEDVLAYLRQDIVPNRPRCALIKFACLLHDIGKPKAKGKKNGKTIFYEHEKYGQEITEKICGRLRLSVKETQFLKNVVFWHLRPGCLAQEGYPTERAIYRFFRDADTEGASIMLLSIADWRATRGKLVDMRKRPAQERVLFKLIESYFALQKKKTIPPLVNGHDIMKKFRLQPSKLVGKLLSAIREEQMLGRITNADQAYRVARSILKT